MKFIIALLLVNIFSYGQPDQKDYAIAKLALEQLKNHDTYRLLKKPNNEYIQKCLDGFYAKSTYKSETLDFRNIKFAYSKDHVAEWKKGKKNWRELQDKIEIIDDFESIPKVSLIDANKSKNYVALSNPAFSNDGQYAIIFYETFTNINGTDAEGFVLIFKKEKDEWVYFSQFTAYLT